MLHVHISFRHNNYPSLGGKTLSIINPCGFHMLLFESKLFGTYRCAAYRAALHRGAGLVYGLGLPVFNGVCASPCFTLFVATFGLYVNLCYPSWTRKRYGIVKQSARHAGTMFPSADRHCHPVFHRAVSHDLAHRLLLVCAATLLAAAVFTLIFNTGSKRLSINKW